MLATMTLTVQTWFLDAIGFPPTYGEDFPDLPFDNNLQIVTNETFYTHGVMTHFIAHLQGSANNDRVTVAVYRAVEARDPQSFTVVHSQDVLLVNSRGVQTVPVRGCVEVRRDDRIGFIGGRLISARTYSNQKPMWHRSNQNDAWRRINTRSGFSLQAAFRPTATCDGRKVIKGPYEKYLNTGT